MLTRSLPIHALSYAWPALGGALLLLSGGCAKGETDGQELTVQVSDAVVAPPADIYDFVAPPADKVTVVVIIVKEPDE